ncbi:hypothetical protein [Ferrovibrio sp.]|uniref:hypothetical protein n=1 Tax=Ferrovibrio sp. TaxID=1917215 RepID=UPI003D27D69A
MIRFLLSAILLFSLGLATAGTLLMLPACRPSTVFTIAMPDTRIVQVRLSVQNDRQERLLWQWKPEDGRKITAGFDIGNGFGDGTYRLSYHRDGTEEPVVQEFDYISGRFLANDVLLLIGADEVIAHTLPKPAESGWGGMVHLVTMLLPCMVR